MDNSLNEKISINPAGRAEALMEMGRFEQAVPLLLKALAEDPENDFLHCRLSQVYFHLNHFDKSQRSAEQALSLNPDNDYAHVRLVWSYLHANHFTGALEHAHAAIRIDPDDTHNLYSLAWAEYNAGHFKKALNAAKKAIELSPDDAELHQLIADLSFNMDQPEQAEKHYREALRHDPNSDDILSNLASVLEVQFKTDEALEYIFSAVKINPQNEQHQEQLFQLVHHDLMGLPLESRDNALSRLDPMIQHFYQDQLKQRGWFDTLRLTSMATLWLLAIVMVTLFFTWATGDSIEKLLPLSVIIAAVYSVLFVIRLIFKYKQKRKK